MFGFPRRELPSHRVAGSRPEAQNKWCLMKRLSTRLMVVCALSLTALLGGLPEVHAACRSSWSKSGYKSYAEIKSEVRRRLGNVQIVRVQLCGEGRGEYFHVVAIDRKGGKTIRVELRISAAK